MTDLPDSLEVRLAEFRASLRKVGTVAATSSNRAQVNIEGSLNWLPFYEHYTPVVGHVVNIDCTLPGSWIVLGRAKP